MNINTQSCVYDKCDNSNPDLPSISDTLEFQRFFVTTSWDGTWVGRQNYRDTPVNIAPGPYELFLGHIQRGNGTVKKQKS